MAPFLLYLLACPSQKRQHTYSYWSEYDMQGTIIYYCTGLVFLKVRTKPGDFSFRNTFKEVPLCIKIWRSPHSCLCFIISHCLSIFFNYWIGSRKPYFRLMQSRLLLIQPLLRENLAFCLVLNNWTH